MNRYMSPCKDCENRELGCHSNCEKYLEFRKVIDHKNKEYRKNKEIYEYALASITKSQMKHNHSYGNSRLYKK